MIEMQTNSMSLTTGAKKVSIKVLGEASASPQMGGGIVCSVKKARRPARSNRDR